MKPQFIRTLNAYARAGLSYLITLIRPQDPIVSKCEKSHTLLKGWPRCPECMLISQVAEKDRKKSIALNQPPHASLYCYEGPHQGRFFSLPQTIVQIGAQTGNTMVLTPGASHELNSHYQLLFQSAPKLNASAIQSFRLNGIPTQSGTLVDFDEIDLLGNKFIFLDHASLKSMPPRKELNHVI